MAARRRVLTVVGMSFATASASLSDLADRRAAAAPGAPCLADSAALLSNADVRDRVHGAARTFADLGVGRGDVVAVMLPNRVELLVTLLAAWRLGAAVTPINPALTPAEAQHQGAAASGLDGGERLDRDVVDQPAVERRRAIDMSDRDERRHAAAREQHAVHFVDLAEIAH